uniref:Uncharacterized protein n=1 Tax=Nymphaea colorata TaxID=210225 RepID=A0A5K1DXZ3_9MAGN
MVEERLTLLRRPLFGPPWQTIPPVVERRKPQTARRLAGEEIVGEREVLQPRQITNALWHLSREQIVRDIELLQLLHLPQAPRQASHQPIEAHVQHSQVPQQADLGRQARV